MTIQVRIVLIVSVIFAFTFGGFVISIYGLPQNLRGEIDEELLNTVQQMVDDAKSRNGIELEEIEWPMQSNEFEIAASFYVVVDDEGQIVKHSSNLRNPMLLYANLPQETADITNVVEDDQTLRVINYPIIGRFENEERLIGYLQIGRLTNDLADFNRLITAAALFGGAALSLSIFILAFMLPFSLRPMTDLIQVAEQITTADDLSVRIPDAGTADEFGQVTRVFNQLMERLEQLFRTQQRLLADVSHELRTPLTAIRGNVDLMRRVGADPESLDAIEMETGRMTRLVNDLLTLARAEVGGLPIRQELVELDMLFLQVYEQVLLLDAPVRVLLQNVMPARIIGDPDRLKQLILNLTTNAIKYTNTGGTVRVSLNTSDSYAFIVVEDTGIGIPADDLPRIFDRFYRVNKARTRRRGGSGLGLSIADSIVKAHGGRISVVSEVDVGSTFTVMLPLLMDAMGDFSDWDWANDDEEDQLDVEDLE